ncbi:unnamed protein product [Discosporangium mesarthrocarpum]
MLSTRVLAGWVGLLILNSAEALVPSTSRFVHLKQIGQAPRMSIQQRESSSWWKKAFSTAVLISTFAASGWVGAPTPALSEVGFLSPDLVTEENAYIRIFEQSTPGVVYINTFVSQRDAFSMNILEVPAGTGSGFVWDQEGHIITNFHVIRCASRDTARRQ